MRGIAMTRERGPSASRQTRGVLRASIRARKPLFWNVDTQVDFIDPAGKLYVAGAEALLSNLEWLTRHARSQGIRVVASMDTHVPADEEISDHADFHATFPPHCLRGTPGQEQVPATRAVAPVVIENRPHNAATLRRLISRQREIVLYKNRFDVFTQPNTSLLLEILKPGRIVVYGVALDVCVYHAVQGFLSRGDARVTVVCDAVRALDLARGEQILRDWERCGVDVVEAAELRVSLRRPR
jgi:nicotinamidase/pyrazinamidase